MIEHSPRLPPPRCRPAITGNDLPTTGTDLRVVGLTAAQWLSEEQRPTARPLTTDKEEFERAARRDDAVVWDIRPTPAHERDRPPRALSLGAVDWVLADPGAGRLTGSDSIARVLRRIGIRPGRAVIVYGGRAAAGFLALRALRSIGIESASIYLKVPPARQLQRPTRQVQRDAADSPVAGTAQCRQPRRRADR